MNDLNTAMAANVRRYPWYLFFRDCYFWGPAFFLYFTSVLTLSQALWLESVYYIGVALLEVPSGWLSDRFGRRRTLAVSSAGLAMAYLLFWAGNSFVVFALAQVFLAVGFASASGTDTALHYESLVGLGRPEAYTKMEGRALGFSFRAGALGALAGGFMAMDHLKWIYGASFGAALVSLCLALSFTDPRPAEQAPKPSMGRQAAGLLGKAFSKRLRFFTVYTLFMTVLVHFPYEFYQPYLAGIMASFGWASDLTPGMTGVHLALTMFMGSLFTGIAGRLRHRCQVRRVLLGAALFQVVLVIAMAVLVHPVVAGLLVCRTLSRALFTPLINAEVSPLVAASERSTYLSLQSLLGRLCYGLVLLVLPLVSLVSGGGFRSVLTAAGGLGILFWLVLRFLSFPQDDHHACCSGHGDAGRHSHGRP